MHSRIGCIYLTFLQCAFSNVSSYRLPEKMHSRIGCIYLTFLHCAFSNVASNCLHGRRHSHIGCIFLASLLCALPQMFPQSTCIRGCIVTLIAFVWFFSTVNFQ